jgi:hypothetical protein
MLLGRMDQLEAEVPVPIGYLRDRFARLPRGRGTVSSQILWGCNASVQMLSKSQPKGG